MKTVSTHGNVAVVYDGEKYKTVHKNGQVMSVCREYHSAFAAAETTRGFKSPYGSGVSDPYKYGIKR